MYTRVYSLSTAVFSLLALSAPAFAQEGTVGGNAGVDLNVASPSADADVATSGETGLADEASGDVAQADPAPEAASSSLMPAEGTAPIADPTPEETAIEAEEDGGVPGWFRVDSDGLGLQLWFGATHDLGGINLATDIYVTSGTFGEFDIGVEIPLGEQVLLIPMVGIGFDWSQQQPTTLIAPQLFAYLDFSPIYIEYWAQFFLNTPFASDDEVVDGAGTTAADVAADTFYNRLFLLYNVSDTFAFGVQTEPTIALNDAAKVGDGAIISFPVGLRANVGYGENNTLGLFVGYETVEEARATYTDADGETQTRAGIVGRFTFLKTW